MPERRRGSSGSSQPDLFGRSKEPKISLPDNHPMVVLTDAVDWTEMEVRAAKIREKKLKNAAGRPPHLRATLGALTLMALRRLPYREVEEQIRHYAPARYLCGLTETDWTPDFTTIQDFAQLMGEDGVKLINEGVVEQAVKLGLADAKVVVADLTAQEAAIPHPNEMGLLGGFVRSLESAAGKGGQIFKRFLAKAGNKFRAAKEQVRKYRLFAKDKTKEAKDKMVAQMANIVAGINQQLGKVLTAGAEHGRRLRGQAVVARRKLREWHGTMNKLVPQIRYWLRTGFVAAGKIINLHIPELYSVVRGKVGKSVEFGLSWGITRLRGGGKTPWEVDKVAKARLIKERALVEGSIGTIKCSKYGFNRPAARSVAMMGVCGQRAVLGLNLTKLTRGAAKNRGIVLVT